VWAVGHYHNDAKQGPDALILHWDGMSWSRVRGPNPSSHYNVLWGVSARSATDAWAVGVFENDTTGGMDALILHWDGTRWSRT